jgi:ABC-type uncharacterized transport system permease subunit
VLVLYVALSALFGHIVSDVAVGAFITGIAITPVVTVCAVLILASAYHATKEQVEESSNPIACRIV